jgi:hypothetical protein
MLYGGITWSGYDKLLHSVLMSAIARCTSSFSAMARCRLDPFALPLPFGRRRLSGASSSVADKGAVVTVVRGSTTSGVARGGGGH